jgi:hypothetical protein
MFSLVVKSLVLSDFLWLSVDAQQTLRVDRRTTDLCYATTCSLPATQGQRWANQQARVSPS